MAAIVEGFSELIRLKLMTPEAERTIATAIVSPSARPRPSIEAEMMPGRAKGRTAVRIISQRVAPSASAASSWSTGVCRKTSRQIAVMIGNAMIASTSAAVNRAINHKYLRMDYPPFCQFSSNPNCILYSHFRPRFPAFSRRNPKIKSGRRGCRGGLVILQV